jgi:hypothetical protein
VSKLKRAFSATPNQNRTVLCGSEALADVPRIAADSADLDVAPTESATAIHDPPDPQYATTSTSIVMPTMARSMPQFGLLMILVVLPMQNAIWWCHATGEHADKSNSSIHFPWKPQGC